jgi:predicted permease
MWRRRREEDLDREVRSDLELEAEEQRESGLSEEAARLAARRAFGNVAYTKEEVRSMWGWTGWQILAQDLRYAWRNLQRSPGFAATAVLTLALGIGASTAVFTIVDSVVLKPLAFRDSGSLVTAWERVRFLAGDPTGPNLRHVGVWQQRATAFRSLTYLQHAGLGLTLSEDHPRMTGAVACYWNLFDVLQVRPLLGRTFVPEDGVPGHENVAILTYGLWQSMFHGDPGVIGKTVRANDTPREIVGVLPENFHFPNSNALRSFPSKQPVSGALEPALFVPVALDITQFEWNGNYGNWVVLGRLKPGVGIARAQAELTAICGQIMLEMPAGHGDHKASSLTSTVQAMQETVVGESRTGLWLLMSAVIGLMLIACLNLANAQLGRSMARRREAAVRTALGASRWRLVWNAIAESLVLAAVGGVAGVLLAAAGLGLFRRYAPVDLPRMSEVQLNLAVLGFAIALTGAASVLSGLAPALRLLASDPQEALQQGGGRSLGSRQSNRVRRWLIGFQVFGCTALLLVTGLFSKSLLHLLSQDRGFDTGRVAIAEVRLTQRTYPKDENRISFIDGVLANLRAAPGVQTAAMVSAMPLQGETWIEFLGRPDRRDQDPPLINLRWVSPGYFEATGQRLLAGRFFEERDRSLKSIVISEGEAKALWGNENPVGSQVRVRGRKCTVIGVVRDSHSTSLKTAPAKMAYMHYVDQPPPATYFVARSAGTAESLVSNMRQAIWKFAPAVTIARVKTLDAQVADSLSSERFQTEVLAAFGTAALLLAMLGIYGVLSYSVVTRKQEIGVRMALGASRGSVYGLTMAEAGAPVIAGVLAGVTAGLMAGRLIQKLLYGIQVVDTGVIVAVSTLFLISAAAAAFLPARRAASVDPMDALRSE